MLSNLGNILSYDSSGIRPGNIDPEDDPHDICPTVDDRNIDHVDLNHINEVKCLTVKRNRQK